MADRRDRYIIEFPDIPRERQPMPELPVNERIANFAEVELGFTEEIAREEAQRCLSCRRCLGCALCLVVCPVDAIDFSQADEEMELEVDTVVLTPGVDRALSFREEKFGYGKYMNVVTDAEFERILSYKGPFGGLVIRPYDGEIPRRIGFVQAFEPRDDGEVTYRCLLYALKEAAAAQNRAEGLEISLFFPHISGHEDELQCHVDRLTNITLKPKEVMSIEEVEGSKNLMVGFSDGDKIQREEFDLVVLVTRPEVPTDIGELSRRLGLEIQKDRFYPTEDPSPRQTSIPGVLLAGGFYPGGE